jgi:hypothetical protein
VAAKKAPAAAPAAATTNFEDSGDSGSSSLPAGFPLPVWSSPEPSDLFAPVRAELAAVRASALDPETVTLSRCIADIGDALQTIDSALALARAECSRQQHSARAHAAKEKREREQARIAAADRVVAKALRARSRREEDDRLIAILPKETPAP